MGNHMSLNELQTTTATHTFYQNRKTLSYKKDNWNRKLGKFTQNNLGAEQAEWN